MQVYRARICKRLWSPRIDSEDSIPPAYVAWRAAVRQIGLSYRPARLGIDSWAPLTGLQIRALDGIWRPQADRQLTEDRCSQAICTHSLSSSHLHVTQQSLNTFIVYWIFVSLLFSIVCTGRFCRAKHPCAVRTRLFRLIDTQNGALPPIAASLFLFSENPGEIPEQGTQFHYEENKKIFSGYTAKNQHRKFETNILRKGTARPQSQFLYSCVCGRFIYSQDESTYSAAGNM
jgi:hypothetical protein